MKKETISAQEAAREALEACRDPHCTAEERAAMLEGAVKLLVLELGRLANPAAQEAEPAPIDMVMHCPACGLQHIDAPEMVSDAMPVLYGDAWSNPPHRSHLCHGCSHIWRPADVPTNGVAAVKTKGKADSPIAAHPPRPQADAGAPDPWREHLAEEADRIDCKALKRAMAKYGCATPEGGLDHFRASLGTMVNLFVVAATATAEAVLAYRSTVPQADAGARTAVPEGWRLVPVEPTPEMLGIFADEERLYATSDHAVVDKPNMRVVAKCATRSAAESHAARLNDEYLRGRHLERWHQLLEATPISAPDTAAAVLSLVIADIDTCVGEAGSGYEFRELSTETLEALAAYRAAAPQAPAAPTAASKGTA